MVIHFQELKVSNPTTHFVLYQDPSHILNTPHGKIFSTNPEFCVMREHIDLALLKVIHMFSCLQQIPTSFANKYICTRGRTRNVDLRVPYGEIWSAESSVKAYGRGGEHARIHGGWKKFARDNRLQVGDAVVIEMIEQQPKITFEVHIYRA